MRRNRHQRKADAQRRLSIAVDRMICAKSRADKDLKMNSRMGIGKRRISSGITFCYLAAI